VKIVTDQDEPGTVSRSWTEGFNRHVVDPLLGPSVAVFLDGENNGLSLVEPGEHRVRHRCTTAGWLYLDSKSFWPRELRHDTQLAPKRDRAAVRSGSASPLKSH
jgi:hypothetical protein